MHPALKTVLMTLWPRTRRALAIRFRGGPEQGGYVHDTATSQFLPPGANLHTVGTWTNTVGNVALTYMTRRTAGAATNQLIIPIPIPQNAAAFKGSMLKSIDVWYEIATAALTSLNVALTRATLPPNTAATGTVFGTPAAAAITFDANHSSTALRVAVGKHHMVVTVTTPWWLAADDEVYLDMTIVDPGTAVYDDYGARANYTFRI
jgi:hypothetical protein